MSRPAQPDRRGAVPFADPLSMARFPFRDPAARELFADRHAVARDTVATLRPAHGHERDGPRMRALIDGLRAQQDQDLPPPAQVGRRDSHNCCCYNTMGGDGPHGGQQ
ncbi:hypothetical protein AB0P17_04465 [Streptomyces sp. NPDC088124]|uniref:MmyB family transcriptional regulator n=1 Tax=Streptomyces sp. NPDC088124 TaxID=3154654 RepID=UPI00343B3223